VERRSVEAIVDALNDAGVRYLIAGGLAVVAHGYVRFTADIDLILDLRVENLMRAVTALEALGYRPRAPVAMEAFCDVETRKRWIENKGLKVFSLYSELHRATEVDIFVEDPIGFDGAWEAARRMEIAPGVEASFVSLNDLLAMKREAGRQQDIEDVRNLETLHGRPHEDPE